MARHWPPELNDSFNLHAFEPSIDCHSVIIGLSLAAIAKTEARAGATRIDCRCHKGADVAKSALKKEQIVVRTVQKRRLRYSALPSAGA